ncbi:chalcone isomerase [Endozoicomonas sp. OPT23]|uniref:chalcone isomerase family protein n=1 Tax=Endozoicomonas sp. OPT23 TaxID=2072845 RepID=UPI00129BF809|nr:chalcone isomerase family protein [Endozoicomonas sp. OPT23]MRI33666.1 chalcone isomerase [Endozoicomonas sp. OPT23]
MKYLSVVLISFLLNMPVNARTIAGVLVPEEVLIENKRMVLNGTGIRNQYLFNLYVGSLYLIEKSYDPKWVTSGKNTVMVQLDIISGMITPEKFIIGLNEGLKKATNGHVAPLKGRLEKAMTLFKNKINKGDCFQLLFIPGKGVETYKNGHYISLLKGDDFSRALLRVWLGNNPIDEQLKKAMMNSDNS